MNPEITDIVCQGLNQFEVGDKRLTVQRASIGAVKGSPSYGFVSSFPSIPNINDAQSSISGNSGVIVQSSSVVQLLNMVTAEELVDDEEYEDILEDVREECSKYGQVLDIWIPRPDTLGTYISAVGKVRQNKTSRASSFICVSVYVHRVRCFNVVATSMVLLLCFVDICSVQGRRARYGCSPSIGRKKICRSNGDDCILFARMLPQQTAVVSTSRRVTYQERKTCCNRWQD